MDLTTIGGRLLRSISVQVGDAPWDAYEYYGHDDILDQVIFVDRAPARHFKTVPFNQVRAYIDHEVVPFRPIWAAAMSIPNQIPPEHLQHPRRKPDTSRIPPKL